MDKKKLIEELVEELNKYAYEYYVLGNSSVTDKDYDKKYYEFFLIHLTHLLLIKVNFYIKEALVVQS